MFRAKKLVLVLVTSIPMTVASQEAEDIVVALDTVLYIRYLFCFQKYDV